MVGLKSAVFLITAAENKVNTMTIAWGSIGIMWVKSVFIIVVRQSRFVRKLLGKTGEFTISISLEDLQQALKLCGTKIGRDLDKRPQP